MGRRREAPRPKAAPTARLAKRRRRSPSPCRHRPTRRPAPPTPPGCRWDTSLWRSTGAARPRRQSRRPAPGPSRFPPKVRNRKRATRRSARWPTAPRNEAGARPLIAKEGRFGKVRQHPAHDPARPKTCSGGAAATIGGALSWAVSHGRRRYSINAVTLPNAMPPTLPITPAAPTARRQS